MRRKPFNDSQRVILLLFQIFTEADTLAVAGATHVHPYTGITVAGEIGVGQVITFDRAVALAIGKIFKNGRNRIIIRVLAEARFVPRA